MIEIIKCEETTELYCHYDGQAEPQGCYVELDCANKKLSAQYNSEIGNAIPFSVFHGHDQRWGIPCLRGEMANKLMEELLPLAERVVSGYESEWDGSNHVARFTDDAKKAVEAIETECNDNYWYNEENATVQAWEAADYLDEITHRTDSEDGDHVKTEIEGYGTITHETTDDEIEKMVEAIDGDLESGTVLRGLDEYLTSERDDCAEDDE